MSSQAVNVRIVYWGIAGAGKTTNLESIRARLRANPGGEVHHEPTRIDPTVTYEVLPIRLGDVGGRPVQIEIVAVPDGEEQAPTRKHLLDEVEFLDYDWALNDLRSPSGSSASRPAP